MNASNNVAVIDEMLHKAKNIALVGIVEKHWKPSYHIGRYLVYHGYRVFPVNAELRSVIGCHASPTIEDAQEAAMAQTGHGIDLVDVFAVDTHIEDIVDDVIRLEIPYLWLQSGIYDDDAVGRARGAGVRCVQDDCIYREHAARPDLRQRHKQLHSGTPLQ